MKNGHSDPDRLLERVRSEVQRRKLGLESVQPQTPPAEASPAISSPTTIAPIPPPQPSEKPQWKRARAQLDRALSKNGGARGWPRFLRGLRRNQSAVNEALIRAGSAFLGTMEWVHKKVALLDVRFAALSKGSQEQHQQFQQQLDLSARQIAEQEGRVAAQRQQLEEFERKLEQQARTATEEEMVAARQRQQLIELEQRLHELTLQQTLGEQQKQLLELNLKQTLGEQQKQLLELNWKILAYQTEVGARFERASTQQLQTERQLIEVQSFVRDQEKQNASEQHHLAELQEFIQAQGLQNTGNAGLLREQQEQLTDLRQLLDGATERMLGSELTLSEMQTFVSAQQNQTAEEQRQFAEQEKKLAEVSGQLAEYQNDACARYHLTIEAFEQEKRRVTEIYRHIEELKFAFPDSRPVREIEILRDKINALQTSFTVIEKFLAGPKSGETPEVAPAVKEELKEHQTDAFYLAFENQFRGDRELIKGRLRFYLPIIERVKATTGNVSAVDVGCGRGEWLELLQEHGYGGVGVDLNLCMIEECRSLGLKVEFADAAGYLRSLPSESLSLVTGFHIVEHLSFAQLIELFQETFRVLCPKGTAIFETPNPEASHVTGYSFYLDPTHRNPIPQELLCFVARQAGFEAIQVERLQAHLEDEVFKGYLDYAGIFTK